MSKIRIASVQFEMKTLDRSDEFYDHVEDFVRVASVYGSAFVVFPEWFTLPLLSIGPRLEPAEAMETLVGHVPEFTERLSGMASRYGIDIIGGSTAERLETGLHNVGFAFLRDGSVHRQPKLHPTPDEKAVWGITGGNDVNTIQTTSGPVAIQICYDSEFPEMARKQVDAGARIFFVPYATDARTGHLRVRYCCQARAVENQCFVVTSGNVGRVRGVENIDINYAQSAILTPCDHPFARDGIASECSENVEQIIFADLDLALLDWARAEGAVQNLKDRRPDLYSVVWHE